MGNFIDKTIGFFSPKAGFKRLQFRAGMQSMERRFEGAADGRRHVNWLMKSNPSVNQLISKDLKNLISRARELSINDPYAKKAPKSIANSVVGTGILAKAYCPAVIANGKITEASNADKVLPVVQFAWNQWSESISCDFNGDYNFVGLQALAMRTIVTSGEIFAIKKKVESAENPYGLQILLLEGDYLDLSKNTDKDSDGGYTYYGIKYDKNSKRAGYWIYDRHPSEGNAVSTLVTIDNIIHVYEVDRPGQNRGVPAASSSLLKQRDLNDYEDAELLGKKAASCMPIFITNQSPEDNGDDERIESLEPGAINYLKNGEQVAFTSPPLSPGFAEFTKTQHRAIASSYGMTYETYTGDLSNVNFSSGRMGWIEYQRQVDCWQYLMMIPKFCDRIFDWFIEAYKVAQTLPKDTLIKAQWTAPRREMIDPTKETTAKRMAIRAGLISWQESVRQDGYDPKQILKEYAEDTAAFDSAGIKADWTPKFELDIQKAAQEKNNANNSSKKEKQQ